MEQGENKKPKTCQFCRERATSLIGSGKWCKECASLIMQSDYNANANMLVLAAATVLGFKGSMARALVREANAFLGASLGTWSGTAYDDRDPPQRN